MLQHMLVPTWPTNNMQTCWFKLAHAGLGVSNLTDKQHAEMLVHAVVIGSFSLAAINTCMHVSVCQLSGPVGSKARWR